MKKILMLSVMLIVFASLVGCSTDTVPDGARKLSFKDTVSVEELEKLDGKEVVIRGYLATSSPADGSFIFLMNLPYQSCPFCIPNTSELANTLEVYPKTGEKFAFTAQAVEVTGVLDFCKDGNFSDEYGYEFKYKLDDASYTIITDSDMSAYQKIADSGLVDELYGMFDYAFLVTQWTEFCIPSFTDEATGETFSGCYMPPSELSYAVKHEYGIERDTFFEELYATIDSLDLPEVRAFTERTEALVKKGYEAVEKGCYTEKEDYYEDIGCEGVKYFLNDNDAFLTEYDRCYNDFCEWLNGYEV